MRAGTITTPPPIPHTPDSTPETRPIPGRSSIRVPAEIDPLAGGEAAVTAPAAGRYVAASLVSIGTHVGAGQTLGRLEPRLGNTEDHATLTSEVAQARVALDS